MRTRLTSAAAAIVLAAAGLLSSGAPVMAQTTTTILVAGTYNGTNTGGPFNVPRKTSLIEVDTHVTDAPPGANFMVEADVSSDGGATWQEAMVLSCPGGIVTTKQGVVQDAGCNDQSGINLDPAKTYLARYTEHSDVPVQASATLTIF